jgi:hypothetical protein
MSEDSDVCIEHSRVKGRDHYHLVIRLSGDVKRRIEGFHSIEEANEACAIALEMIADGVPPTKRLIAGYRMQKAFAAIGKAENV